MTTRSLQFCISSLLVVGPIILSSCSGSKQGDAADQTPATPPLRQAPQPVTANRMPGLNVSPKEIELAGKVKSVSNGTSRFQMLVDTVTSPSGAAIPLKPPRSKSVLINSSTQIHLGSAQGTVAGLNALKAGESIMLVGPDTGVGKPIPGRMVIVMNGGPLGNTTVPQPLAGYPSPNPGQAGVPTPPVGTATNANIPGGAPRSTPAHNVSSD